MTFARKLIVAAIYFALSCIFWIFNDYYPDEIALKLFYTAAWLTALHVIFKIIVLPIVERKAKESKTRYSGRKALSAIHTLACIIIIVRVWIINPQALLVAYGLVAAGVAVSLQDLFKNFAGGIVIFTTSPYRVGDRIEINGKYGDVIDISPLFTTVLELREWVQGDQATGRLSLLPNGYVLSHAVNNYTKDHEFIWDEIHIPVTYSSDVNLAMKKILSIVASETKDVTAKASQQMSRMHEKYYVSNRIFEPMIFIRLTDNWIDIGVRYTSPVRERRILQTKLSELILTAIQKNKRITIASATVSIVGFPDIKLQNSRRKASDFSPGMNADI